MNVSMAMQKYCSIRAGMLDINNTAILLNEATTEGDDMMMCGMFAEPQLGNSI